MQECLVESKGGTQGRSHHLTVQIYSVSAEAVTDSRRLPTLRRFDHRMLKGGADPISLGVLVHDPSRRNKGSGPVLCLSHGA